MVVAAALRARSTYQDLDHLLGSPSSLRTHRDDAELDLFVQLQFLLLDHLGHVEVELRILSALDEPTVLQELNHDALVGKRPDTDMRFCSTGTQTLRTTLGSCTVLFLTDLNSYDLTLFGGLLKGVGEDLHVGRSLLFGFPMGDDVEAYLHR